jgi:hypothetical protein
VPFGVLLLAYALTDAITTTALYVGVGVACAAMLLLLGYWLARRILPCQRELEELRAVVG